MAQDFGDLIEEHNPYSNRGTSLPVGPLPGSKPSPPPTGEMDLYAGNPMPVIPPAGTKAQMIVEVDNRYGGDYAGEWLFKGQPQRIAKALRFRYRIPVLDSNGNLLSYVDDYLLVGFEGSNG
jgi:hypothetical protein